MVLDQHHHELEPLGHGRDELGVHHQVGAVPDHDDDVARVLRRPGPLGLGHGGPLDPEPAGDLVAHAGERVLDVVAEGVLDPPHLVQVTGQRARRAHDDVAVVHGLVDGPDDLVLAGQRQVPLGERRVHGRVPALLLTLDGRREVRTDPVPAERPRQFDERLAGVGDDRHGGALLVGVERRDVDVDEAHVRVLERGAGRGGEVLVPGADADHQVGLGDHGVGGRGAGGADGPEAQRVVPVHDPHARLGVGHGDPGGLGELGQRLGGEGVVHPAAGDDHGPLGRTDRRDGRADVLLLGRRPADPPLPGGEELLGHLQRLGLHVLRERDRHGAGLGRVREHPHAVEQRREELLGPPDAVEVAADRPEDVVDGDVVGVGALELLEHRVRAPGGELVRGEQQRGQPVRGGQGGAGHHVGGAGADRGGHREGGPAPGVPGVADGLVHLGLLVAALVVGHQGGVLGLVLLQGLAHPGHVAVAEDAEHARDRALPVLLGTDPVDCPLVGQELHERLGDGEGAGAHRAAPSSTVCPLSRDAAVATAPATSPASG